MYAKIINEKTKACEVGIGANTDFYRSIGMSEMDVEQAFDGAWYVAGFAPEKPEELIKKEEIAALKAYLRETDWIVVKIAEKRLISDEKGVDEEMKKYAQTLNQRETSRARINELEKVG